ELAAAPVAVLQQGAGGGASWADGDRLQADVLVEDDEVGPVPSEMGEDLGAQRAVDGAAVRRGGAHLRRVLRELDGEHAQRVGARVGGDGGTAPVGTAGRVGGRGGRVEPGGPDG